MSTSSEAIIRADSNVSRIAVVAADMPLPIRRKILAIAPWEITQSKQFAGDPRQAFKTDMMAMVQVCQQRADAKPKRRAWL